MSRDRKLMYLGGLTPIQTSMVHSGPPFCLSYSAHFTYTAKETSLWEAGDGGCRIQILVRSGVGCNAMRRNWSVGKRSRRLLEGSLPSFPSA